ncbi:hypothetical protein [Myceligenerans crystallogenes]|uniref:Uncharacterized protein n=1 Tax=Myceligenerans crystallogenes TaxID=316335 RepID=A0ABN2N874_9MICO
MADPATAHGSTAATLALWEALGTTPPPAGGAVVLLARGAAPDLATACDLPLAVAAQAALAELRERTGPTLATVLDCAGCGDVLDVALALDALAAPAATPAEARVPAAGGDVVVRTPTTTDVLAALESDDPGTHLRERCEQWPPGADRADRAGLADRVADAAEALAGAAAARARVTCPGCGRETVADVDVVRLLAERVTEQASALLADVAELAGAFGWSEDEILAMSPWRRRAYLGLTRAGA